MRYSRRPQATLIPSRSPGMVWNQHGTPRPSQITLCLALLARPGSVPFTTKGISPCGRVARDLQRRSEGGLSECRCGGILVEGRITGGGFTSVAQGPAKAAVQRLACPVLGTGRGPSRLRPPMAHGGTAACCMEVMDAAAHCGSRRRSATVSSLSRTAEASCTYARRGRGRRRRPGAGPSPHAFGEIVVPPRRGPAFVDTWTASPSWSSGSMLSVSLISGR